MKSTYKKSGKYRNGEKGVNLAINVLLLIVGIVCIYPIWYVLIASISSPLAISRGEVLLWPIDITLDGYSKLIENKNIWTGYRNSLLYTAGATCIDLFVQIPAAYALSRTRLPGGKWFMILLIIPMYFSGGMIPTFLLVNALGMVNTPWALMLPACLSASNLIIARSFFTGSIPDSLFDAARIDGCSYTRFFVQIVLPLSKAMLAVITLYCIQGHWNGYLGPQMYLYDSELFTLQQVIRTITAQLDSSLTESMGVEELVHAMREKQLLKYSVIVVSVIPLVIAYPFVQKFFVRGVMVGAVKG